MSIQKFPKYICYAFFTVVDLIAGKVLRLEDLPIHSDFAPQKNEPVKIPKRQFNYDPSILQDSIKFRDNIKPLEILSPKGPSFHVNGNEISWQKFNFRIRYIFSSKPKHHRALLIHKNVYLYQFQLSGRPGVAQHNVPGPR